MVSEADKSAKPEVPVAKIPKKESGSKTSSNLATRKDVVMKSLIRAIKRFYCDNLCNGKQLIPKLSNKEAVACLDRIDKVNISGIFQK